MANNQKVGGNSRKKGRVKAWCTAYQGRQQRERNKAKKLADHIRRVPWDQCARDALAKLPLAFRKGLDLPPLAESPSAKRAAAGVTLTFMKRDPNWRAAA